MGRFTTRAQFFEQFEYDVEVDFSIGDITATWANANSKGKHAHRFWGDEDDSINVSTVFSDDEASWTIASAVSPDGEFLAASKGNLISVYHISTKELRSQWRGPVATCQELLLIPCDLGHNEKGYRLITESSRVGVAGATLHFWSVDYNGRVQEESPPIKCRDLAALSMSAIAPILAKEHGLSSSSVLLESALLGYIKVLETLDSDHRASGLKSLRGELPSLRQSPFSADGQMLLCFESNVTTQHGSRPPAELPHIAVYDISSHTIRHRLAGHEDHIMWAAFSPEGQNIASAAWDQTFRIWDAVTGECKHVIGPTGGQNWAGAWSPDSQHVLFSGMAEKGPILAVYSRDTGSEVARFNHESLKHRALSLNWSMRGDIAIANGINVWIWKPFENAIISAFKVKTEDRGTSMFAGVSGVSWVNWGSRLILKTGDGTIEVWDRDVNVKWRMQRPVGTKVPAYGRAFYWLKNQDTLVSLDGDGKLRFYELR